MSIAAIYAHPSSASSPSLAATTQRVSQKGLDEQSLLSTGRPSGATLQHSLSHSTLSTLTARPLERQDEKKKKRREESKACLAVDEDGLCQPTFSVTLSYLKKDGVAQDDEDHSYAVPKFSSSGFSQPSLLFDGQQVDRPRSALTTLPWASYAHEWLWLPSKHFREEDAPVTSSVNGFMPSVNVKDANEMRFVGEHHGQYPLYNAKSSAQFTRPFAAKPKALSNLHLLLPVYSDSSLLLHVCSPPCPDPHQEGVVPEQHLSKRLSDPVPAVSLSFTRDPLKMTAKIDDYPANIKAISRSASAPPPSVLIPEGYHAVNTLSPVRDPASQIATLTKDKLASSPASYSSSTTTTSAWFDASPATSYASSFLSPWVTSPVMPNVDKEPGMEEDMDVDFGVDMSMCLSLSSFDAACALKDTQGPGSPASFKGATGLDNVDGLPARSASWVSDDDNLEDHTIAAVPLLSRESQESLQDASAGYLMMKEESPKVPLRKSAHRTALSSSTSTFMSSPTSSNVALSLPSTCSCATSLSSSMADMSSKDASYLQHDHLIQVDDDSADLACSSAELLMSEPASPSGSVGPVRWLHTGKNGRSSELSYALSPIIPSTIRLVGKAPRSPLHPFPMSNQQFLRQQRLEARKAFLTSSMAVASQEKRKQLSDVRAVVAEDGLAYLKPEHMLDASETLDRFSPNTGSQSVCIGGGHDDLVCYICREKYDDADGYLAVKPGMHLGSRFLVEKILGQGTFGTVLQVYDMEAKRELDRADYDPTDISTPGRSCSLALKVIRSIPKYRRACRTEIRILQDIHRCQHQHAATEQSCCLLNHAGALLGEYGVEDAPLMAPGRHVSCGAKYCIQMQYWFEFKHHLCMAFPLLKTDLYCFMERCHFSPFPLRHIQQIGHQILTAVSYLHDLGIIHTDLKPENIMLYDDQVIHVEQHAAQPNYLGSKILAAPAICLIDFGSALYDDAYHADLVSTRHYRAPEIILECGWSFPCDCWSVGCILMELYMGHQLFNTHDNLTHLKLMEVLLGPFPDKLVRPPFLVMGNVARPTHAVPGRPMYFDVEQQVAFPAESTPTASLTLVESMSPLSHMIPAMSKASDYFYDLIRSLLALDPSKRMTSKEALQHPFFTCPISMEE